jgi:hypothetical protein
LVLLVLSAQPRVEASTPAWRIGAAGWSSSPLMLAARPVRGLQLTLDRTQGLLVLGARLSGGLTTQGSEQIQATHYCSQAAAAAGVGVGQGAGRVWLLGGVGARLVYERLRRHQDRRLRAVGMDPTFASSWLLVPVAGLEGGVSVTFYDRFQVEVAGGPWLSAATAAGTVVGWQASLGVSYASD